MEAAARLAWAICVAHDDRAEGRTYEDVLAASQPDVATLLSAGPVMAVMTLLRLVDLAVTAAAAASGRSRQAEVKAIANTMLDLHAPEAPRIGT